MDLFSFFLIIAGIIGVGGTYFVAHDGKSQMYFLFGCLPVLALFTILNLRIAGDNKLWKTIVTVAAIVLLLPTGEVIYNNIKSQKISYVRDLNRIGVGRNFSKETRSNSKK